MQNGHTDTGTRLRHPSQGQEEQIEALGPCEAPECKLASLLNGVVMPIASKEAIKEHVDNLCAAAEQMSLKHVANTRMSVSFSKRSRI